MTYAEEHTPTELAAWLRRRVVTTDPKASEDRRARKLARRELSLIPLADGMALLTAYGSAHLLGAVLNTAHACALARPADDERTLAQATFDAFVELVRCGAAAGEIPGALGRRARIVLTPDPAGDSAELPAVVELAGVGAVPGSVLDDVARDAQVSYEQPPPGAVPEDCDGAVCAGSWVRAVRADPPGGAVQAIRGACSLAAGRRRPAATWTTRCRGRPARPVCTTWRRCAGGTTS